MSLATAIRQWQAGWMQARELANLGLEERQALARDIGISEEVLAALVARGPQAGAELPRLMTALGLDPEGAGRSHAALMRDMSVVCTECSESARCRRDLDRGEAEVAFVDYCPNAAELQELRDEHGSRV